MELSPLYQQRLENAARQGKRLLLENLLRFRFGELDEKLSAVIEALLYQFNKVMVESLPLKPPLIRGVGGLQVFQIFNKLVLDIPFEEVPPFAIDFSREELIRRFRN